MGNVLDESETDVPECFRKVVSGRKACRLMLRVLPEAWLMVVLLYGSETMKWREKERSMIRAVHNSRNLLVLEEWTE